MKYFRYSPKTEYQREIFNKQIGVEEMVDMYQFFEFNDERYSLSIVDCELDRHAKITYLKIVLSMVDAPFKSSTLV